MAASTCLEARELFGGVRVTGFVGDREMGAHPGEAQLGPVDDLRRELDRVVGAATDAMHSGVDLQMYGELVVRVAIGDRLGQRVDARERVDDRREPVRDHARRRGRYRLRQHEDRRVDPRLPQLDPFLHERDTQSGRARLDRGSRNWRGPVTVTVGLDHREQCRGRAGCPQRAHIGAHSFEIDLGPDRPVPGHRCGFRLLDATHCSQGSRPVRNTASVRGRASTRSDATMSGLESAALAARPCT